MRPLIKDKIDAERAKQRRKNFAGFDLPSTSYEWSDDQNYAYKAIRDGLGMDALKAEQYVNKHTDTKKPSGRANLFYPATKPTEFERDVQQKLVSRNTLSSMKLDESPPVTFASQSGHVLGEGEARKPQQAPAGTRPLFDEAARWGRQVHFNEQAAKIAEENGYKNGKPMNRQQFTKPSQEPEQEKRPYSEVRTDPVTKKRIVTAKFGDKTFEFERAYTADELFKYDPIRRAKFIANPHAMQMQKIEGISGHYYTDIKNTPDGYKAARDEATSVRFAKDVNKAATVASLFVPPVGAVGTIAAGYVAAKEPSLENYIALGLSAGGARLLRAEGVKKGLAERISAIEQMAVGHINERKK